jgi:hypothetical protein
MNSGYYLKYDFYLEIIIFLCYLEIQPYWFRFNLSAYFMGFSYREPVCLKQ